LTLVRIDPFVVWKTFPWLNLPQKLLTLKLKIEGALPISQFRLLGSYSIDAYNVHEIRAMYDALVDGHVKVLKRDSGDPGQTPLITDCDGCVLMTVAGASEMVEEKRKRGVRKAAVRAIARAKDKGGGAEDEGEDVGGSDGGGPIHATSASVGTSMGAGVSTATNSRKRPWKGGDRQGKAKRSVKSSEFIEDSDGSAEGMSPRIQTKDRDSQLRSTRLSVDSGTAVGTPSYGMPLPPRSNHSPAPAHGPSMVSPALAFAPALQPPLYQSTRLSVDSGSAVGTPSYGVPRYHTSSNHPPAPALGPSMVSPALAFAPALPSIQLDLSNDGLGQTQAGDFNFMNLPPLDPSLLQGPGFDALLDSYNASMDYFGSSFNL
jgi:hypothetical protein